MEENFQSLSQKDNDLESRIAILEEEVELLKNRPIQSGVDIDYSKLISQE